MVDKFLVENLIFGVIFQKKKKIVRKTTHSQIGTRFSFSRFSKKKKAEATMMFIIVQFVVQNVFV